MPITFANLQVDEHLMGRGHTFRCSTRAASTSAGTLASSYAAGQSLDGITLAEGDRILLKNQADPVENGVYVVKSSGAPERATDYSVGTPVGETICISQEGTMNADIAWLCTNNWGSDVVGTDELSYVKFNKSTKNMILTDEKASTTDGGTFTSGAWQTRTLNTAVNNITGASLSSNQFILPAGSYTIFATAPGYKCEAHKARIQNITDATTLASGTTCLSAAADASITVSVVAAHVTLSATKTFELQHQCGSTQADNGFGLAAGFTNEPEVYAQVVITQTE